MTAIRACMQSLLLQHAPSWKPVACQKRLLEPCLGHSSQNSGGERLLLNCIDPGSSSFWNPRGKDASSHCPAHAPVRHPLPVLGCLNSDKWPMTDGRPHQPQRQLSLWHQCTASACCRTRYSFLLAPKPSKDRAFRGKSILLCPVQLNLQGHKKDQDPASSRLTRRPRPTLAAETGLCHNSGDPTTGGNAYTSRCADPQNGSSARN